jgi:hypothetical protein
MAESTLMGIYGYLDDLIAALKAAREKKLKIKTVYTPTPRHEIAEALGKTSLSPLRYATLCGGILGIVSGLGLTVYSSLAWKFIVGGKPVIPIVPSVIVAFEFCILFSILFNVAALLITTRMPRITIPDHYDPRFSGDRFGVLLACSEGERETAERILKETGAEEVHDVKG